MNNDDSLSKDEAEKAAWLDANEDKLDGFTPMPNTERVTMQQTLRNLKRRREPNQ